MFIKQNKKIENLSVYWFHNKKSFTQRKIKRSLPRALEEKDGKPLLQLFSQRQRSTPSRPSPGPGPEKATQDQDQAVQTPY